MKDISSSEYVGQANPKLGDETPVRPNLGEKTNWSPVLFMSTVFILTSHSISSLGETVAQ